MDRVVHSDRVVSPLFQAEDGGSIPTSALQLRLVQIDLPVALGLNRLWHSRLPRLGTGAALRTDYLCYGAVFDGLFYSVAIWSNPTSRKLPQWEWLELRRLAIAPDAPRNTASRMLAVMARLVRRAKPEVKKLISYQDMEVHTGGIYAAAGWTPTIVTHGPDWANRGRPKSQTTAPKRRWEKDL